MLSAKNAAVAYSAQSMECGVLTARNAVAVLFANMVSALSAKNAMVMHFVKNMAFGVLTAKNAAEAGYVRSTEFSVLRAKNAVVVHSVRNMEFNVRNAKNAVALRSARSTEFSMLSAKNAVVLGFANTKFKKQNVIDVLFFHTLTIFVLSVKWFTPAANNTTNTNDTAPSVSNFYIQTLICREERI
jgi:hypothetical protein